MKIRGAPERRNIAPESPCMCSSPFDSIHNGESATRSTAAEQILLVLLQARGVGLVPNPNPNPPSSMPSSRCTSAVLLAARPAFKGAGCAWACRYSSEHVRFISRAARSRTERGRGKGRA